ncbi:MAG: ABC transporter permease subunit [Chloroflexi bacterium]|nr:ABC transporter permease subunit [Chloroflexota bacterium]
MRNAGIIAMKEFKSYLASPMAYVVVGIFLALTGVLFASSSSTYLETSIRGFLQSGVYSLLLLAAVITMRLIAEERKLGTVELLLTAPVRDSEIIAGKFLGSVFLLAVMLVLTFYYPILLKMFGDPDWGAIAAGYLGLFLVGCTALAVGLFASTLTANQIVSAVVAGGILFALWLVGLVAGYLPRVLAGLVNFFSLAFYFPDFVRGVIDTRGVIYYVSLTVLFLFLAVRSLENSRWS